MRLVFLAIGTLLTIMFAVQAARGGKYKGMLVGLDVGDFPLNGLYTVGLAWSYGKILKFDGKIRDTLVAQAKLLYDPQYAEYYATLVWAQTITFVHIFMTFGFLLAGLANFPFLLVALGAFAVVFGYMFMTRMSQELATRKSACVAELPEVVSTMALLINSGMVLRDAWRTIAYGKDGVIYDLMRDACINIENGMSEVEAYHKFGVLSNCPEVKKFIGSLVQGAEKGGKDLSLFLVAQSSEMWELKKQIMLQKGEAAASKLLMPTALIFVGIMLLVVGGAIGTLL